MQSSQENKLRWPTLLLFFPGIVKYAERTRALYLSSLDRLKDTILTNREPSQERNLTEYVRRFFDDGRSSDCNIAVVHRAFRWYKISMGLLIDLSFDFFQRKEFGFYILRSSPEEVYTLIATELNFMYEALYTKVFVVHSKRGYVLRAVSFCAVCIAFVYFFKLEKHGFHGFDVGLTYSLLSGAITLDFITIWMFILSDTTVAALEKSCREFYIPTVLMSKYLNLKRSWWSTTTASTNKCSERTRQLLFRRWSESVSAFSFINYSLQECGRVQPRQRDYGFFFLEFIKSMGLKDVRDEMKYRSKKPFTIELWDLIYTELRSKSVHADAPGMGKEICSARGEWILRNKYGDMRELETYIVDVTYDRSILIWHIATELCYYTDASKDTDASTEDTYREFSKTLSDYMLYLLMMQPALMSSVAGIGRKRFCDTMEEAIKFYKKRAVGSDTGPVEACRKFLEVNTQLMILDITGDGSKSVLFEACYLAKKLMESKGSNWELIVDVWVELLSYAASHCRVDSHGQLLSKGGELVTFVWILMARFGIAEQFRGVELQGRTIDR